MENFGKLKLIIVDYLNKTRLTGCKIGLNNQSLYTELETIEKLLQNEQYTDITLLIGNFIYKIMNHEMNNNHTKFGLMNDHYQILKELPENVIDFLNEKQFFGSLGGGCHGCIGFKCINTNTNLSWFLNINEMFRMRPRSEDIIKYMIDTNIDENIYVFFTFLNDKMYFKYGVSLKSRELLNKISKLENEELLNKLVKLEQYIVFSREIIYLLDSNFNAFCEFLSGCSKIFLYTYNHVCFVKYIEKISDQEKLTIFEILYEKNIPICFYLYNFDFYIVEKFITDYEHYDLLDFSVPSGFYNPPKYDKYKYIKEFCKTKDINILIYLSKYDLIQSIDDIKTILYLNEKENINLILNETIKKYIIYIPQKDFIDFLVKYFYKFNPEYILDIIKSRNLNKSDIIAIIENFYKVDNIINFFEKYILERNIMNEISYETKLYIISTYHYLFDKFIKNILVENWNKRIYDDKYLLDFIDLNLEKHNNFYYINCLKISFYCNAYYYIDKILEKININEISFKNEIFDKNIIISKDLIDVINKHGGWGNNTKYILLHISRNYPDMLNYFFMKNKNNFTLEKEELIEYCENDIERLKILIKYDFNMDLYKEYYLEYIIDNVYDIDLFKYILNIEISNDINIEKLITRCKISKNHRQKFIKILREHK